MSELLLGPQTEEISFLGGSAFRRFRAEGGLYGGQPPNFEKLAPSRALESDPKRAQALFDC